MTTDQNKTQVWIVNLTLGVQLILIVASCIGLCCLAGFYIDRWAHTKGIFMAIFSLLGLGLGIYIGYRQVRELRNSRCQFKQG